MLFCSKQIKKRKIVLIGPLGGRSEHPVPIGSRTKPSAPIGDNNTITSTALRRAVFADVGERGGGVIRAEGKETRSMDAAGTRLDSYFTKTPVIEMN
jgi:hypothetical protein